MVGPFFFSFITSPHAGRTGRTTRRAPFPRSAVTPSHFKEYITAPGAHPRSPIQVLLPSAGDPRSARGGMRAKNPPARTAGRRSSLVPAEAAASREESSRECGRETGLITRRGINLLHATRPRGIPRARIHRRGPRSFLGTEFIHAARIAPSLDVRESYTHVLRAPFGVPTLAATVVSVPVLQ